MKVCLIEPPKYVSLSNFVSTIAMPPIGLSYIAAVIEQAGHDLVVVDACGSALTQYYKFKRLRVRGLKPNEIAASIPKDTEVIAMSCMFSAHWLLIREILKHIRTCFPDAFLVLGGEHGTGAPELSLQQAPVDAVVMGEGEETIVELLNIYKKNESFSDVKGIAYRNGGEIHVNPRRERIKDLDSLPLPAWEHFPLENYHRLNQPHGANQGLFMPMLATRGCPYSCTFCTNPNMWTTKWLSRAPKLVVDEIQLYMEKYKVTDFQFEDLTVIVRKDWIEDFCDEIIRRKMNITFQLPSGTRIEAIDYEIARKMKAAGCHDFAFAPESGDLRVLQAVKKKMNLSEVYKSAQDAMRAGISVGCFFIIGFPEDDWLSVLRTYKAILKCGWLGFANANINAYSPQPNTESFSKLVKEGVIKELNDEYLISLFSFQDFGMLKKSYNPHFSSLMLTFMVVFGAFLFYTVYFIRHPQRIWELAQDLARKTSTNKTTKVMKAMLGELWRIAVQRLNRKAKGVDTKNDLKGTYMNGNDTGKINRKI